MYNKNGFICILPGRWEIVMNIKKAVLVIVLALVLICSATTVFAENAGEKSVTSTEDTIIPTNGYLESADAVYFLRFVFNDDGGLFGNLSDADIMNSDFYKLCTGELAGTDKETVVIKVFLEFLYPQMNRYIGDGWSMLNTSRANLQAYLEDKCAGMQEVDEQEFNNVRNEALKQLENGFIDFLTSQVAINTGIYVTENTLENIKAASSVYGGILSLPDKIESFVDTAVTAFSTCLMPMGSELTGRYTYFASYLNCRNMGGPEDIVFQTAMDYNFLACKSNSGLAVGFINWLPGKVKWTERRRLIEHWAEFVYQLEQKRAGQPIGTVDSSTYYYENPTEDETINFNWKLYDNGNLVIWAKGDTGTIAYSSAPWNNQKDMVRKLFIVDGITSIGSSVFSGYSNLEYVSIPESVTSIGSSAFDGCSSLVEVEIPESVTTTGQYAFRDCTGLREVRCHTGEVSFSTDTFSGCSSISRVEIEGSGDMPEYGSPSKTAWYSALGNGTDVEVTVGEGITSVGSYAFESRTRMTAVTLPETVRYIGAYAFSGCVNLEGIDIPGTVTVIGGCAFQNCTKLAGIRIPEGVKAVKPFTFYRCYALKSAELSGQTETIGEYAFNGCVNLEGIDIPGTVTAIGSSAFDGCSNIGRVKIEGSGDMPEYGSPSKTAWYSALGSGTDVEVTVGEGITSVGRYAFQGRTRMTVVTLPETVRYIGAYAFNGCSGLKTVIYNGTREEWSDITIGLYNDPLLQCIIEYYIPRIEPDFILPASTRVIEDEAFAGIKATSILVGDQVESIGSKAFANCTNLQQIVIPESVVVISENAFEGCNDIVIFGVTGSCAETYAESNGFTFRTLE